MVLEFISETEGTDYSINPHYPYGRWYFYERIIQVSLYGIFQPETKTLDLFRLVEGRYEPQVPDENSRFWIPEMNLFNSPLGEDTRAALADFVAFLQEYGD
jgi:hypothetical protein